MVSHKNKHDQCAKGANETLWHFGLPQKPAGDTVTRRVQPAN